MGGPGACTAGISSGQGVWEVALHGVNYGNYGVHSAVFLIGTCNIQCIMYIVRPLVMPNHWQMDQFHMHNGLEFAISSLHIFWKPYALFVNPFIYSNGKSLRFSR
jgi:hypothetical protein